MKTAILLSVILASCQFAHAQDKYLTIDNNVNMVLTDEPCGEATMRFAYAEQTELKEQVRGCWFAKDGEAFIRMRNGEKLQDYRYLESSFKAVE